MKIYKCKIPTWALNYLVNAETDGLTEEDLKIVTDWEKSWPTPIIVSPSYDEPSFEPFPEFGLAADCEECDVITEEED